MLDQQPTPTDAVTYSVPLLPNRNATQPKSVEIVRAESELNAIDELMADLTADFVSEATR